MNKDKIKNDGSFDSQKAKNYYESTEKSYDATNARLSERGNRPDFESQMESSFGLNSEEEKDLPRLNLNQFTVGEQFGKPGLSVDTLVKKFNSNKRKIVSNKRMSKVEKYH